CAEAIRQAVSATSFAVDESAGVDDDGWLLISKKDSEVYSLLIHAFRRRSDPNIFWWACHVRGNRTILEWLAGRAARHHMDALCAGIENAARARGKATDLRWMTAAEFNQFA
ncbi:MAG TPA: hypothetical protein VFW23_14605, partial [Tepidisphaeraceae bacterium]|nr:hypothetical protein [Tepidisphaeraceae bacterium]